MLHRVRDLVPPEKVVSYTNQMNVEYVLVSESHLQLSQ
jgi:hypothetical protein